jgi:uncharacterized protein YyaL (SSP411 family)
VLADWNGLMIAALTHASFAFERKDWLAAAERAFDFVATKMSAGERLWHSWRAGQTRAPATAADYANMIWAALRLYQVTGRREYLQAAELWVHTLDRHYWLPDVGGYATTADDTPDVLVRLRSAQDDATPSANSTMLSNLVQLWLLTGTQEYLDRAAALPAAFAAELSQNLVAHCGLLAASFDLIAPQHVVVLQPEGQKNAEGLLGALRHVSLPGAVQQIVTDLDGLPASGPLAGKTPRDGLPTAYACIGPQCSLPVTDGAELGEVLRGQRMA